MSSSPEPVAEAEAGPSRPTPGPDSSSKKPNGRKRKAGGDGKKGKIFLEDKAGLLSLMANVTGDKDSIVKTKLDNQRRRNPENAPPEPSTSTNIDKSKLRHDKKKDRNRALRDAKFALVKEAKDKKREKKVKARVGEVEPETEKPKKKRVGFA